MPTRGAWVRERKPKAKDIDPTVALLPTLRYLGCRPNMREPRREKTHHHHQESPEFDEIEIVAPPKHHQTTSRHQHAQQQPGRQLRNPTQELRGGPTSARPVNKRSAGRPAAGRETPLRALPATRLSTYSREGRPHAGAPTLARNSTHMTRAMAVNLNAITPLAM